MKPLPHQYGVTLSAGASGYGGLSASGLPELRVAPPPSYDGPGDAWSPEHLLLAAVVSCYLFTLRAVLKASKIEFIDVDLAGDGTVDRQHGVTHFTDIVVRPTLVVPAITSRDRALRALQKAADACLVSASLKTMVRVEAEVVTASPKQMETLPRTTAA